MREWLASLSARERVLVIAGAVVLVAGLFYSLVWSPLQAEQARLREQVAYQTQQLEWMRQAARQVETLRGQDQPQQGKGSVLARVDRSAEAAGLGKTVRRVQPQSQGTVRVWLDGAPFDRLMTWVGRLHQEHGIRVEQITVDRADEPGLVSTRLVLRPAGGG